MAGPGAHRLSYAVPWSGDDPSNAGHPRIDDIALAQRKATSTGYALKPTDIAAFPGALAEPLGDL